MADFEEERGPHSDTETGVDHGGDVDPLEEGNGNAGGGGGGGGGGRRGGGVGSGDSSTILIVIESSLFIRLPHRLYGGIARGLPLLQLLL